jgi:predicted kinase
MTSLRPRLVLVTGAPGTGKTTLAVRLGRALTLPVLSRDSVKELLTDALDPPESNDTDLLVRVHVRLFFGLLEYLLSSGPGLVVEAPLDRELAVTDLQPAVRRAETVIVHCHTDRAESRRRFAERFGRGERHRSHRDAQHLERLEEDPNAWDRYREPPAIGVPILYVDTSSDYAPSFGDIVAFARSLALAGSSPPSR